MRHGEAAALRWNDIDLKRGTISISRSRDEGEDNATKRAASSREIPMLPWVVDLLKRLPRRLHFDGSEFVFLSPEGKPMTDTWWPKRGAAHRPVDDESKGIWFRCLRSLGIRPRKFLDDAAHVHRVGAFGGSQLERACGILWNVPADDRAELGRFIRKDFLGPLIAARPKTLRRAAVGEKTGPPLRVSGKRPEFPTESWWRRGELNPRPKTFRRWPLHACSAI
jgi:hypothetical protein